TLQHYRSRLNKHYYYYYSLDGKGNLKKATLPYDGFLSARAYEFFYNASTGILESVVNPESIVTQYEYNTYHNVTKVKSPALNIETETVYDDASRPIAIKDAKGAPTNITYWECDIPKTVTDPLNHVTSTFLDANYNVISVVNAKGDTAKYTYDEHDRDSLNKFLGLERYHYYPTGSVRGKLQTIQKPTGTLLLFTYDNTTGLLKSNGYASIQYYADNMPMKVTKGGTLINQFVWEANEHWLMQHTDPHGNVTDYTRRVDGSLSAISYPNGNKVTHVRDTAGRPYEVWWNKNAPLEKKIATYYYKRDDRVDSMVFGNGITTRYQYDAGGRMVGLYHLRGVADTVAAWTFVLDSNGNIRDLNTLKQPLPTPPPVIGTKTQTYDPYNVLANANGIAYTTNADGNITARGSAALTYDNADKLTSYTNGSTAYIAKWDGLGHRVEAVRNGVTTRYVLDISGGLDNVLAETNGSNAVQYYYVHGPGGILCRIAPNGTILYYQHDHRGNTVAMTNAAKAVTHSYAYGEYGEVVNVQESDVNRYRFMGAYGITYEDSILYYVRARHYDPTVGRFYSQDPINSVNLYNYAGNNPLNGIDPTGMYKEQYACYPEPHDYSKDVCLPKPDE
ncbi:MAG TPA: RHS repeat-associated core domain-containing protein, partial [Fibrella sp.]